MPDIKENETLAVQSLTLPRWFYPETWTIACGICNDTVTSTGGGKSAFGGLLVTAGWRHDGHMDLPLCPPCVGRVDRARAHMLEAQS